MNSTIMVLLAATSVYRLELTDEKPYIVGEDGAKREVCIVDPAEYAMMTGRMDQVWKSLNAKEDGRRSLHGVAKETVVSETEKVTVYADGYCHREKMEKRKAEMMNTFAGRNEKNTSNRVYSNMSERQRAFMEKRDAALSAAPKTVTVEHNAATGKDIVK